MVTPSVRTGHPHTQTGTGVDTSSTRVTFGPTPGLTSGTEDRGQLSEILTGRKDN